MHYFGRWDDLDRALAEYNVFLASGNLTEPRNGNGSGLIRAACNRFLTAKLLQQEKGELSPRSFTEYKRMCKGV